MGPPFNRIEPARRETNKLSKELRSIVIERIPDVYEFQYVAAPLKTFHKREIRLTAINVLGELPLGHVTRCARVWLPACSLQDGPQSQVSDAPEMLFGQERCSL